MVVLNSNDGLDYSRHWVYFSYTITISDIQFSPFWCRDSLDSTTVLRNIWIITRAYVIINSSNDIKSLSLPWDMQVMHGLLTHHRRTPCCQCIFFQPFRQSLFVNDAIESLPKNQIGYFAYQQGYQVSSWQLFFRWVARYITPFGRCQNAGSISLPKMSHWVLKVLLPKFKQQYMLCNEIFFVNLLHLLYEHAKLRYVLKSYTAIG